MTIATTLTSTLSSLDDLGATLVELIGLIINMFYISIFLGDSLDLCSALEQIIKGYQTCILIDLIGYDFVSTTNSIDLTMTVGTTGTSFFWL